MCLSEKVDALNFITCFPNLISLKLNFHNLTYEFLEHLPRTIQQLSLQNCKEEVLRTPEIYHNLKERLAKSLVTLKIEYNEIQSEVPKPPEQTLLISLKDFASNMKKLENLSVHIIFKNCHFYSTNSLTNLIFYSFHQNSENLQMAHFNYLVAIQNLKNTNSGIKMLKIETSDGIIPKDENEFQMGIN
jgi:hypothetical protein